MTDSALARKMKRTPAARAAIINAPAGYPSKSFAGLPPAAKSLTGKFDWVQIFVKNSRRTRPARPAGRQGPQAGCHSVDLIPQGLVQDPDRPDAGQGLGKPGKA